VLEPTHGQVIAKLGDFGGIDRNGAPIGFLWSNSLVFHGDDVLVTNLSLDVGTALSQLGEELGNQPEFDRISNEVARMLNEDEDTSALMEAAMRQLR